MDTKEKNKLINLIIDQKKFKASNAIIIFSEARGGSTWLMEILAKTLPLCINWEPLHNDRGVLPKDKNFGWRPFIPENNKDPFNEYLFKKIHSFKLRSDWTMTFLDFESAIKSKYVLTKYVRANRLVPYILKNFKFKRKPIYLFRHPLDVCLSQIKAFDKGKEFNMPQWEGDHKAFLDTLETELEAKIANWCLSNCSSIKYLDTRKLCVIY